MPDELERRLAEIGSRLSGRRLVVELRQPSQKGARGEYCRSVDTGYIRINPDLPHFWLLDTFCHECAHARLHWDILPPVSGKRLAMPPQSVEVSEDNLPAGYYEREDEAGRLGDAWLKIATRQPIAGYSILESGLMALERFTDDR